MQDPRLRLLHHDVNRGKGAALRTASPAPTADYVVVQDADLEYDAGEYGKLLRPLLEDRADVVYGSRFAGGESHRVLYFWHSVGNKLLTLASNMATNLNLTDMETCYKAFRREVIQSIEIEEDRFGFEPEITAKLARAGVRIYEVGISYDGRTYAEGKKIGWRDGVWAIVCIVRYGIGPRFRSSRRTHAARVSVSPSASGVNACHPRYMRARAGSAGTAPGSSGRAAPGTGSVETPATAARAR